jgi:drug/metabolite transporter (DMT)-like permease
MASPSNQTQSEAGVRPSSAYISLIAGLVIIGISPILLRLADAPGPVSGFYRMAIGWLLITPWFIHRQRQLTNSLSQLRPAILAGLFFGGDMVLWTTGVMLAGATIPTLFANTSPLWVGLGALLVFKEKLKPAFWLGLLLALAGAVLIFGTDEGFSGHLVSGGLMGIGSGIFYGSFFLAGQRSRDHLNPVTFLWVVSFVCSLVLLAAAIALGQPLFGYPARTYLIFIAMGVLIQVFGWILVSRAQGELPASLVAPTMLGQPVVTAILAIPLLGETLSPPKLLGGITVILGVYLVHRSKQHNKEP